LISFLTYLQIANAQLTGEFTQSLLSTQNDLSSAHMYFQIQLSLMTQSFDSYMATLNEAVLPYLAGGVDDFNQMRDETQEDLTGAHPTCLNVWDQIQVDFGRQIANCAENPTYEVQWMLLLHNLYSWYAEVGSNPVQTYGLSAFRTYEPLADEVEDVNLTINRRLQSSLQRFLTEDYEDLSWLEKYVFDYFEDITFNSYFCMYSLIGRFATATSNIVADAASGPCES
jgi:hypothetical protein